jgi:hypothetical protein
MEVLNPKNLIGKGRLSQIHQSLLLHHHQYLKKKLHLLLQLLLTLTEHDIVYQWNAHTQFNGMSLHLPYKLHKYLLLSHHILITTLSFKYQHKSKIVLTKYTVTFHCLCRQTTAFYEQWIPRYTVSTTNVMYEVCQVSRVPWPVTFVLINCWTIRPIVLTLSH